MKRVRIIYTILTIFLLISLSCSEDWLKPDPLSFYAPENVYVDEAGFEAGLVRLRKEINYENMGNWHPIAAEVATSDLAVGLRVSDFTKHTPSRVEYMPMLSFYTTVYGFIKNANTIKSRIDNIEWDNQNIRNRILAEALWFRAYWYYRLVNTYGDVPWIGEELTGVKLDFYSTSRWTILEKLQDDLEFAVQWLPVTPARLGNVTKGAANHLLTKVYLANGEFDKAIASATEVINGPYALMTERFGNDQHKTWYNLYWDLFRSENMNSSANTETIYTSVAREEAPSATWWDNVGNHKLRNYTPSYWKVLDATGNRACNWNTPAGDTLGIGNGDVRTNDFFHYRIWEDESHTWQTTPDLRRATGSWVEMGDDISDIITCREGSPNFGQPLTKEFYGSLADTVDTWYPWPHYRLSHPTPNFRQPRGGQTDWYIFRLAETYLLRAEAYFWKEQYGPAADDINMVRARAQAPLITAGDVTLDYIFDERARELYAEEPRHSEMVRASFIFAMLNRDGYSLQTIHENNWYYDKVMRDNPFYSEPRYSFWDNTATIHPHHILWPVPQSVITANTLGRINQNIGYDGDHLNVPPLEVIE